MSSEIINLNKKVPLWSIDDDTLFHPLGMKNLSSETKTVITVWNEDYLLNFVIKKQEQTTIKKVRISLPDGEVIKDLLVLEFNTLLLMESGRVYYFISSKSVHIIPWLSGVQSISQAGHIGFSVLRLQENNKTLRLVLEVHREAMIAAIGNDEETTTSLFQSFEIPMADMNLFNHSWANESFTLLSVEVLPETVNFFLQIIGCEENSLFKRQILHFFSVSTDVYVLISTEDSNDDFNVQLVNRYASDVMEIKIMPLMQMCCIFLKCGLVDIWHISRASRVLKRLTHTLESPLMSYDFPDNSHIFYYASGSCVFEVNLKYNSDLDFISVEEKRKIIPGILACTWVPRIQQLVCLSWNNVFYEISFDKCKQETTTTTTTHGEIKTDLEPFKKHEIQEKSQFIRDLMQTIATLEDKLKIELKKRELLAFVKNCSHKKYFKACVQFHLNNNQSSSNFGKKCKSIFALIKLNLMLESEVFTSMAEKWNLVLDFNGNGYLIANKIMTSQQELCVELSLKDAQDFHTIFDNISLRMISSIADADDDENPIFLELPIDLVIEQKQQYIRDFCSKRLEESDDCKIQCKKLLQLYENATKTNHIEANDDFKINYELQISEHIFQYLWKTFEGVPNIRSDKETLNICMPTINMNYNRASKILTLMSPHPPAIYFIKLLLLNYACEAFALQHNDVCVHDKIEGKEREALVNQTMSMRNKLEETASKSAAAGSEVNEMTQLFCMESFQVDLLQEMFLKLRKDLQMFTLIN